MTWSASRITTITALLPLAALLSACSLGGPGAGETPNDPQAIFKEGPAFVRLEPIEPGTPDNSHPVTVGVRALRALLAGPEVEGTVSAGAERIFSDEELDQIVQPLARALAKAGPQQDVVFASASYRGLFGKVSAATITMGRLFVSDGRLNLILGNVHERNAPTLTGESVRFELGSRARQIEVPLVMHPGTARLHDDARPDWLTFELPEEPTRPAAPVTAEGASTDAATPTGEVGTDSRYQAIEQKLQVLERLRDKGLISEEEYRERRQAVLQDL